jgi:hypothetical protein
MFRMGAAAIPGIFRNEARNRQDDYADSIEESHYLLLELSRHEPTLQNCFSIMKSACLSRGIKLEIDGQKVSDKFNTYIHTHYIRFCEHAIHAMFTCGFVPWRLRRLENGDVVPEVIPLGLFKWAAETTSNKRRRVGYSAQGNDDGEGQKSSGHANQVSQGKQDGKQGGKQSGKQDGKQGGKQDYNRDGGRDEKIGKNTSRSRSFQRQWTALGRQPMPIDDDDSKLIRYRINFTENCGIREEDVEIYEYIAPSNNISQKSTIHQTVMSPLSHIIMDYKHLRSLAKQIAYADCWNAQAKFICSYQSTADRYNINEGNPIRNDWMPQNRMGNVSDSNIPCETEQNAYVRDAVLEKIVGSKDASHVPTVYTLPKNSRLETAASLGIEIGSVDDISKLLDLGLVTCENAVDISNMLLGVELHNFGSKTSEVTASDKVFVTPANTIPPPVPKS